MRVALVTAVWERHALTELFWAWTAYLREWWHPVDLVAVAVGTNDPVHARLATAAGAEYVETANLVARKFNLGLKVARGLGVDAVLVMGSDDLFCERTARAYLPYLRSGVPYAGLQDLYYYDLPTGRGAYFAGYRSAERLGEPAGCGRLIPGTYLQRLGWSLWNERPQIDPRFKNHGADHGSFRRLALTQPPPCPLIQVRQFGGCAVDIKSDANLWPFDHPSIGPHGLPRGDDIEAILGQLPAPLIARLGALRAVEAR